MGLFPHRRLWAATAAAASAAASVADVAAVAALAHTRIRYKI